MANEYKLVIQLDESQLTKQQEIADGKPGKAIEKPSLTKGEETATFLDKVKGSTAFKAGASIAGVGIVAGKEVYDYKLTSAQALGYENKSLRMQEGMKNVQRGATLLAGVGLLATGNPLGLVAIGYEALNLAKDNRQRVIAIELDSITSQKQTHRLLINTSERSRD